MPVLHRYCAAASIERRISRNMGWLNIRCHLQFSFDRAKAMTHIDNWAMFGDGLIGQVRDHERQDDFKMMTQYTSPIVEMNEAEGWCQTQNTRYTLGEKMKSTVLDRQSTTKHS